MSKPSLAMAAALSAAILAAGPASAAACAPAEPERVSATLDAMFDALARDDAARLGDIFAPDFYAYDAARRFDGMALAELIRSAHAAGKVFRWSVTRPEVHLACDMAWISYVNEGAVGDASAMTPQTWLESAVLRFEGGRWRIAFLHSTRVPPAP